MNQQPQQPLFEQLSPVKQDLRVALLLIERLPQDLAERMAQGATPGLETNWRDCWNNCISPVVTQVQFACTKDKGELGENKEILMNMADGFLTKLRGSTLENNIESELMEDVKKLSDKINEVLSQNV